MRPSLAGCLQTVELRTDGSDMSLRGNGTRLVPVETWPSDENATFGYPPLETARAALIMDWRGVGFGDFAAELY